MTDTDLKTSALWEEIFQKRPTLKTIVAEFGQRSVFEYIKSYLAKPAPPGKNDRAEQFLSTLNHIARIRLPATVVDVCIRQLEKNFTVSTVDHHGPVTHPFFLNPNLILALWVKEYIGGSAVIPVLSTASISLNNSSFPRGFLLHAEARGSLAYDRLSLFGSQGGMRPVFSLPAYGQPQIQHLRKQIIALPIPDAQKQTVVRIISEACFIKHSDRYYAEQITRINYALWRALKHRWKTQDLPDLVTVEQETLVAELLCQYHLGQDTLMNEVLCNPAWHEILIKHCSGIQGAFDFSTGYGTFLFWGKESGTDRRLALSYHGSKIISESGSLAFALQPQALRDGLRNRQLIPSMLLCFIVLNFYYGLECFGGFSQADYQTQMNKAFIRSLEELSESIEADWVRKRSTQNMIEGLGLAYITKRGSPVLATLIDLFLYDDVPDFKKITTLSKKLSLWESMVPYLPFLEEILLKRKTPTL
jgi:hypothetical protein